MSLPRATSSRPRSPVPGPPLDLRARRLTLLAAIVAASVIVPGTPTSVAEGSATVRSELEIELVGRSVRGRLAAGYDPEKKVLGLEERQLPIRDVLRVRFRSSPIPPRWTVSVRLADGSRIHGTLLASDDPDRLRLEVPSLVAPLAVPLEWVREIRRGAEAASSSEDVEEDRIETTQQAAIDGVIETVTPEGVTIEEPSLGRLEVPWDRIERVRVAPLDPVPPLPEDAVPCIVASDDGGRWFGALRVLDAERLEIESALLGPLAIPEDHRVSMEMLLDRVAYLSDRDPLRVEEGIPFSEYFPWTWKRDRNVLGGPLRIGRETYRKGIGVHSRSALTFPIAEGDLVFRAEVGIDVVGRPVDDNAQVGSVRFVVLLDGEEAWRSGDVGWADAPRPVEVPLAGKTELTLLVEMGLGHHVLDRADWGDARILRE